MNNLILAILIGGLSQILFFNKSKDLISDTDINKFMSIALSTVHIYGFYSFLLKKSNLNRLLVEAVVVGILTLIIGKMSSGLVMEYIKSYNVDSKYSMEIIFITTGILIHLFCEFTGINKWYITNGVAAIS